MDSYSSARYFESLTGRERGRRREALILPLVYKIFVPQQRTKYNIKRLKGYKLKTELDELNSTFSFNRPSSVV